MKTEASILEKPAPFDYPVAIAVVTLVALGVLALFVLCSLRLDRGMSIAGVVVICVVSLIAIWISIHLLAIFNRTAMYSVGVFGALICAGVCWWALHTANFQLNSASYSALNAAHVPADLIAELKNAEGTISDTDQQFVAGLSTKLGQDHIAPYRDALVQSCWNCHQRVALAGLAGFCACLSLTVGVSLGSRLRL